mmetsp:Transcript_6543/g.11146  ORF Transcript_6543/g.11146 Transcript_6543/m.11146 type:complete len:88 (+) Transcript_6543:126-389(+)
MINDLCQVLCSGDVLAYRRKQMSLNFLQGMVQRSLLLSGLEMMSRSLLVAPGQILSLLLGSGMKQQALSGLAMNACPGAKDLLKLEL